MRQHVLLFARQSCQRVTNKGSNQCTKTHWFGTVGVAFFCIMLSGCGWQLRGIEALQQKNILTQVTPITLNLNLVKRNPELLQIFNNINSLNNIHFDNSARHTLTVHTVDIDKRHLAVTETGVAAQFLLTVTLSYSVSVNTAKTPARQYTLTSRRDYDFDATQIVAKKQEEQALISELYEELAQQTLLHARLLTTDTKTP